MEEIILDAMKTCALDYSKGFTRWMNQWDERHTIEQKAKMISDYLESQGYIIIKADDLRPLCDENGE